MTAALSALAMAMLLGFAPTVIIRLIAISYPKAHPRRRELLAEYARIARLINMPEVFRWLGETTAAAAFEAPIERAVARRARRRVVQAMTFDSTDTLQLTFSYADGSIEVIRVPESLFAAPCFNLDDWIRGLTPAHVTQLAVPHAEIIPIELPARAGRHRRGR